MPYDKWRKRLEIAKLPTVAERRTALNAAKINNLVPDAEDEGYYRKPVTARNAAGKNEVVGWVAVAYYLMNKGKLAGVIGDRFMTPNELCDEHMWSWVITNPIEYQLYDSVVNKGGKWPDLATRPALDALDSVGSDGEHAKETVSTDRIISRDDNKPPEVLPEVAHAEAIRNAIGAGKDLKVTTVDEAAVAAGAANIIRDRRLAAEKIAKAKVYPLKTAYETERNKWLPLVKEAQEAEDAIRAKVSKFEGDERRRIAAEQLVAIEKQREIDEANARAADRAIANGEPELPPVVEEVAIPQAPERTKPTYGNYTPRAKPVLKFAVIEDAVTVYRHFASHPDLIDLIEKLATRAIRDGLSVPGATTREGTE